MLRPKYTSNFAAAALAAVGLVAAGMLVAAPAHAVSLGTAGTYAGVAVNGQMKFTISSGGTLVDGDVFVGTCGGGTCLDFSGGGTITGSIDSAPGATISLSGGSTAGGQTVLTAGQAAQVGTDVAAAISAVSLLGVTQSLGAISGNTTIVGTGGLNVIDATSVNLQGGSTLTLSGTASDFFVVRVGSMILGDLTTGGNSNIDSNGVGPSRVLFVVDGDITMSGGTIDGTYISVNGDITLSGGIHNGAYILAAEDAELKFQSAPTVNFFAFVPEPGTLAMLAFGLGGLGVWGRRRA